MSGDHQTTIAMAALVLWPIASLLIFASSKTFSRGLIWAMLSAQLLLPVGAAIKFKMVPQIDKASIASFSAVICCIIFARGKPKRRPIRFGLVEILLLMIVVGPFITSELNPDNIIIGDIFLPGVGLYDAVSAVEASLIAIIPFVLGRRFLRSSEDCYNILFILTIAGLCYTVPLLFEIRFSPQLHFWVYGYYPSDFIQTIRESGFRPMVFMGHGLLAAFFLMTSLLAATALWRNRVTVATLPSSGVVPYLGVVLLLCKSLGALIYGIAAGLLVFFAKPKTQFRVASLLVTISLMYPLLRSFDLVPTTQILQVAELFGNERAGSLGVRFNNEDRLLQRAFERPLFGWGRFGRSRVYDAYSGQDISVTDGRWIIDIGQFGLFGFLSEFGLLSMCVYRAASAFRLVQSAKEQIQFATLALMLSINIFDLLPNASLIPWTWLLAGALLGQAEALVLARRPVRSMSNVATSAITPARRSASNLS